MTRKQLLQEVGERSDSLEQSQVLRSLMGSAPQLSKEEQNKRKTHMKKMAKEQGEGALDTFLSEKLGLDF